MDFVLPGLVLAFILLVIFRRQIKFAVRRRVEFETEGDAVETLAQIVAREKQRIIDQGMRQKPEVEKDDPSANENNSRLEK